MDPSKPNAINALSMKELLFTKNKSNIAERVKNFLPQIAKANAELEEADEETRQSMILEDIEQLKDDSSSDESSDNDSDSSSENEKEENNTKFKGDQVEIIFTKFEEREPDESTTDEESNKKIEEDEDFIIRRTDKTETNT